MFSILQSAFSKITNQIKLKRILRDTDIDQFIEDLKISLLDADISIDSVNFLTKYIQNTAEEKRKIYRIIPSHILTNTIKNKMTELLSTGEIANLIPAQVKLLADKRSKIEINKGSTTTVVGLQGSGKTTSIIKLANYLKKRKNLNPLLVSVDIHRPAARDQLKILADQENIAICNKQSNNIEEILQAALLEKENYDCLIIDTAGRSQINEDLMQEINMIHKISKPSNTYLVMDSMIGQEAVKITKGFLEHVDISGVILSKVDGDSKGGSIFSIIYETKIPVKLMGNGEKASDFEEFHPDRIVSRIFGEGDVTSLMEKTSDIASKEEMADMEAKIKKGHFDLNDMKTQLQYMSKLGGIQKVLKFIPGIPNIDKTQMKEGEKMIKSLNAIISSMTSRERTNPEIIRNSRRKLIIYGSGTSEKTYKTLIERFSMMKKMMSGGDLNMNKITNLIKM